MIGRFALWTALAVPFALPGPAPAEIAVDSAMQSDPELRLLPEGTVFPEDLAPLWIECLSRPEADLRREAAETIAKAHRRGMKGLQAAAAPLAKLLAASEEALAVRLAAARALIELDAREHARPLAARARLDGLQMALLVEPVLARWEYAPIRKEWLARIDDKKLSSAQRRLAIDGLTTAPDPAAAQALRTVVLDKHENPDLRLAAARALAGMSDVDSVHDAQALAADRSPAGRFERQLAAELVAHGSGSETETLLLELAGDPEPAVAAVAWRRLIEIDPELTAPLMAPATASPDAKIRRLAAEALSLRPSAERVAALASLLNDPHPSVRSFVCEALFTLAGDGQRGLRETVIAEAMKVLMAGSTAAWRGHEQASLLLATLDHEPAADRLVALLDAPREEVFVTAAWALRKLAVPATYPALLDKAQRETDACRKQGITETPIDLQLSQIFQAFGAEKYAEAAPLLKQYIPKSTIRFFGDTARCAAVWSLGWLHEGQSDPELAAALADRLADDSPTNPESLKVRGMAAVALGRMAAKEQLPVLRTFQTKTGPNSEIGYFCSWAIQQLTGEPMPAQTPFVKNASGWFLEPVRAKGQH
jgi:HEAT repeat protein